MTAAEGVKTSVTNSLSHDYTNLNDLYHHKHVTIFPGSKTSYFITFLPITIPPSLHIILGSTPTKGLHLKH